MGRLPYKEMIEVLFVVHNTHYVAHNKHDQRDYCNNVSYGEVSINKCDRKPEKDKPGANNGICAGLGITPLIVFVHVL